MKKAVEFEKREGSIALLKAGFSALSRILVKKKVITEKELKKAFLEEIK